MRILKLSTTTFASLKIRYIILLILVADFFTTTHAQKSKAFNDTSVLNEIVVTSTRTATKLGNVAVPTRLIAQKYIQQTGSLKLQDVLQEFTGITLVNSNLSTSLNGYPNPFGQGIQMLGLDPAYTAVLLDGEPLVGRNAGILKLGRVAIGNIKQIEIVKGPSSSLYGSEAMAGVINIISAQPTAENFQAQLHAATNNSFSQTLSYSNRLNKTGIQIFANRYATGGYDLDPATYGKTMDPYRDFSLNLKLNHSFSSKAAIMVSARAYDSKQNNDYEIYWNAAPANVVGYTKEKDNTIYTQFSYKPKDNQRIFIRSFFNQYQNRSFVNLANTDIRFDETSFDQTIIKPEVQYEVEKKNHKYITGAGLYLESIDASRYAGKQNLQTIYTFSQTEWTFFQKRLTVIGGLRLDKRTDYALNWSPRIALAYKPNPSLKIMASAGYGFKAPDFRHMYLNFYNAQIGYSLIGANILANQLQMMQQRGELESGSDIQPYLSNNQLLPEKSVGTHLGCSFNKGRWNIETGIFRNDISNLIDVYLLPIRKTNNRSLYSYRNINRIYTQGIETDITFHINRAFAISAGYQYLEAKDKDIMDKIREGKLYKRDPVTFKTSLVKESDYFGLNNRSKHQVNGKINWTDTKHQINAFIRCIYRGDYGYTDINGNGIADDERELVKGYWLANITLSKSFSKGVSIQTGADNIFNYTNYLQMPNIAGRLYFVNMNYNINQLFNKNKARL